MKLTRNTVNESTVLAYSRHGSSAYEDPMNKNFLYGKITTRFLDQVKFSDDVESVLDIGCGTGFGFDHLYDTFKNNGLKGIGVEPAKGMLDIAVEKYGNDPLFSFSEGSFESIPLEDRSVDKIISTLALHWVKSLDAAAQELRRVLRDNGSLDILMIARDDGANFKKAIVNAQKKHLTFGQIMKSATLVQRATEKSLAESFACFKNEGYDVKFEQHRDIVYGTFDEHMKWWTARSSPVIAEVVDKGAFMSDLQEELEKTTTAQGIPFDTAYFWITIKG